MKKILNVAIIIGYLWFSLALLYNFVLPPETKEALPQINNLTFLFSGTTMGAVAAVLQYVKQLTGKQKSDNLDNMIKLYERLSEQEKTIDMLKGTIEKQNDNINNLNVAKQTETKKQDEIINIMNKTNKYLKVELESRRTNPFTDQEIKDKIGVLLDEKDII